MKTRMEEENIIDDLISENRNDFDEITSRSTLVFEELSNKVLDEPDSFKPANENLESINDKVVENDENAKIPETKTTRPCQFAISRIKTIMKLDPELALTSKESVFLITKATVIKIFFLLKLTF